MSCLTNGQKAHLAILARRAYDRVGAEARASQTADEYRRAQVAKVCGKGGLRLCSQLDYKRVEFHFLNLIDETGRALNANMRAETEERRQILWKIRGRCRDYGITIDKANGIARQMFHGQALDDLDAKGLWNVYFKLRYYEGKQSTAETPRRGEKQGVMA